MRDPYQVLSVPRSASDAEIKSAYRKLAKKYHPDTHAGDETMRARFHEVTTAYEQIRDASVRTRHRRGDGSSDTARHADFRAGAFRQASGQTRETAQDGASAPDGTFEFMAGAGDAAGDDMFGDIFGGLKNAGKRAFRTRGSDQTYDLSATFLEAALGAKRRVRLPNGKTLEVKIPAGVEQGQHIRLKGQGGPGFGGAAAGDVLITVAVEPHRLFRREGRDIHLDLPVSLREAVWGAKVAVPTIHGPVTLSVPEGSNGGTRLRLKGKGIKPQAGGGPAGDQYVTLSLKLPDAPDGALRDFLKTWRPGMAHNPRNNLDEA